MATSTAAGTRVAIIWMRASIVWLTSVVLVVALSIASALYHVYFSRSDLPDIGPFTRFQFPAIGHVYDARGQPLIELAREYREITQ